MAFQEIKGDGGVRPYQNEIRDYHEAAARGDLPTVEKFVRQYPAKVDAPYGDDAATALIVAASRKAPPMQELVKSNGAYDEIVAFLLQSNAHPDARTKSNVTALQGAARTGNRHTLPLIIGALKERYQEQPGKLLDALTASGPDGLPPETLARSAGDNFRFATVLQRETEALHKKLGITK